MADIRYLSLCSYCFPYQVFLLQFIWQSFFWSSQDSPSLKCTYKSQVILRLFIGYSQVIYRLFLGDSATITIRSTLKVALPLHFILDTIHKKNRIKMRFFLHIRKFYCNFAPDSYAGGSLSCEKRFAKVLSWVGFGHIEIAFIALCV